MHLRVLVLLAGILWLSAATLLVIGWSIPGLAIFQWAAIPDGLAALVFAVLAARRWARGPD
jgi:hypothetical protein